MQEGAKSPRKCESTVKGFDGCTGIAQEGSVACGACYREYSRRSGAMRAVDKVEMEELFDHLAALATSGVWRERPRIALSTSGLFKIIHDGVEVKPKAKLLRPSIGADGRVWLTERVNSARGVAIGRSSGWYTANSSLNRVAVLDAKGNEVWVWESSTPFAPGDVRAKELADRTETKAA